MSTVVGKVNRITQKDWNGNMLYGLEVAGKNYGTGTKKPSVSVGDYVSFTADTSGKFAKADVSSIRVTQPPAEEAPSTQRTSGYTPYRKDDKTQEVISRQAARNSAIAMFEHLRALDALPVPAKTAKAGERYELFVGILDELTTHFYNYSMGKEVQDKASSSSAPKDEAKASDEDKWDE